MISEEKRARIVAMYERGYRPGEIAEALGVSGRTVGLWLRRDAAGEGVATREHVGPRAQQVSTTEAGYVVAGLAGWFRPSEARAATGVADTAGLFRRMRGLGAVEKRGGGPATEYRSLVTPREWLTRRGVVEGAYPFEYQWPVSCGFQCHLDRDPPSNAPGVDYAAPWVTPVKAIAAGKVGYVRWRELGGRSLWVDHGENWRSYYAHLHAVAALTGERVAQGQVIGYVGSTGHSTGPHLHFSVKRGSVWVDPELVIDANSTLVDDE